MQEGGLRLTIIRLVPLAVFFGFFHLEVVKLHWTANWSYVLHSLVSNLQPLFMELDRLYSQILKMLVPMLIDRILEKPDRPALTALAAHLKSEFVLLLELAVGLFDVYD